MRAHLTSLLRPEVVLPIDDALGDLVVKESDSGASLRKLTIKRVPPGAAAVQLDYVPTSHLRRRLQHAFKQLSCLIHSEHKRANKKCDAVVFVPISHDGAQRIRVLLIDMKSSKPAHSDCRAQLLNSELYVGYMAHLLREYHGLVTPMSFEKIIIHAAPPLIGKSPTRQKGRNASILRDGIRYVAVHLAGYRNSEALVTFNQLG